ncbi:MAG: response regulator [candidate division Zixibacteria bacterium]|nr:response regulator [candidate division Zixibacteria bacterium]
MEKKNLIFVNDQNDIQAFIDQISISLGDDWEVEVVNSGRQTLEILNDRKIDLLVSELVLPDMSGAELFKEASEKYPGVIRFILTANTDRKLLMQTLGNVHQYLPKPCDSKAFLTIMKNSVRLREILSNEQLHARIAGIKSLPSPPHIYNQLIKELQSDNVSMQNIANLIKKDMGITAKLLQMINSAYFGLKNHIESPLQAVNMLGLDTVKNLVLTVGTFSQFKDPGVPGFSLETIYNYSVNVGACSRTYATILGLSRQGAEDALMAGMLFDIGKLIMVTNFYNELQESSRLAYEKSIPLFEAEREVMGVSDAEIGAHLLSLWGLPDPILEAVALHYAPRLSPSQNKNVLTAVHLAYATDHDQRHNILDENSSAIDMEYLSMLNLQGQVQSLRSFAMATAK